MWLASSRKRTGKRARARVEIRPRRSLKRYFAAVLAIALVSSGVYYVVQTFGTGPTPPPAGKGTLKVFGLSGGVNVVASIVVTGSATYTGTTTLNPNSPLTFVLDPGSYIVTGTYNTETLTSPGYPTISAGQTSSITLTFMATLVVLTGTWTQLSNPVITQDVAGGPEEPNVIYEGGTFKMWYRDGWNTGVIRYTTSSDGRNWNAPQTLSGFSNWPWCPYVFKYGSTYYMYVHGTGGTSAHGGWDAGIDRYVSSDGINWIDDAPNTISHSGWTNLGNLCVWVEGGSWKMLLEAIGADNIWSMYLATSTDGRNWSFYSYTPVLSGGQGPDVIKSGNTYYLWYHAGQLPTQIYAATSRDLISWTPLGLQVARDPSKPWEASQVADPSVVVAGTQVWMFFDALSAQAADHSALGAATLTPS